MIINKAVIIIPVVSSAMQPTIAEQQGRMGETISLYSADSGSHRNSNRYFSCDV